MGHKYTKINKSERELLCNNSDNEYDNHCDNHIGELKRKPVHIKHKQVEMKQINNPIVHQPIVPLVHHPVNSMLNIQNFDINQLQLTEQQQDDIIELLEEGFNGYEIIQVYKSVDYDITKTRELLLSL